MSRDWYPASIRNVFFSGFACFALSACVDELPDQPDRESAGHRGEILKSHELVGSVGDGPVVNADVRFSTASGNSLMTVQSDSSANFALVVRTKGSHYPLQLEVSGGTDLVTMATPDFTLRSAVLKPGKKTTANLNPFTTFAMELASDLSGGISEGNIHGAVDIVVAAIGSGLDTLAVSGPLETAVDSSNIAEMVRASESLGETVRRTRDALAAVGRSVSGNAIVAALGSDLTDGAIDGHGGRRADARIAAVATIVHAQVMIESMANRLRVQGSDATSRMNAAMSQVFSGTPKPGLSGLTVTSGMLDAARLGTLAGSVVEAGEALSALRAELDRVHAGMTSGQVDATVKTDSGVLLDNIALAAASASADVLEQINTAARTGALPTVTPLEIAGQPDDSIVAGTLYRFVPAVSNPEGGELSFDISGLPRWATFDSTTGRLAGTPGDTHAGTYPDILISVSNRTTSASLAPFSITVHPLSVNGAPEISGEPATSVVASDHYDFKPQADDADGDPLSFSVTALPSWGAFDTTSGRLFGTPKDADVGVYRGIAITVSDGQDSTTLGPFSIDVVAVATGSVMLNWYPPIENTDGTALTDLAAYRIYWGTTPGSYPHSVLIDNPGLTTYVVENLSPGTYEFVTTAINASGIESDYSNAAAHTVP